MSEDDKVKFLDNPHFKKWTEKERKERKEIPPEIQFDLWNNFTNTENRLATHREVINDETYGEFKVGYWQDNKCRKWNKGDMSEDDKVKFLANPYFKEWTEK